jgi:cell division protein FtsZ
MTNTTVIKVIGLGGGGSNAIDRMIQFGIKGVEFVAANTDMQALSKSLAPTKLLLGQRTRRGLGAGGNPENGELAAEESAGQIRQALSGADMVFLTAGMGGGTGTGSIPVAARVALELGAITVAIVTVPFMFEGTKRARNAQAGLVKLQEHCHSLIVVPNDKLLEIAKRDVSFTDALTVADEVLRQGVQGMAELITRPSMINVDFANVCSLMQRSGGAFLAVGNGKGPNKTLDAVNEMLHHRLLDSDTLAQASGVLVHFTGGSDLTLHEINQAITLIRQSIPDDAMFVMGAMTDENLSGRTQIILIATGVGATPLTAPIQVVPSTDESAAMFQSTVPDANSADNDLAHSLFAGVQASQQTVEWVVAGERQRAPANQLIEDERKSRGEERLIGNPRPSIDDGDQQLVAAGQLSSLSPDNLDLPAFLRRRRNNQQAKP